MKYSLADYILGIQANDPTLQAMFGNISVGGQGSMIGSINVEISASLWSTESFPTGGWVHNKNLSKVGTIDVNISQLSDVIRKFKQMCNIFYANEQFNGFTITLIDNMGNQVLTATDCYVTKIPRQTFEETVQRQDWSFTCGEINFN